MSHRRTIMSAVRLLPPIRRCSVAVQRNTSRAMGGGGHSKPQIPFARNLAPQEKLHEDHELVWDDGVAPELTIDFDAQNVSKGEGLAWWLGGLAFFASLFGLVSLSDPASKNPAVNREFMIIKDLVIASDEEEEEEEEE